jgi:predicted nucleic acid-binding protein
MPEKPLVFDSYALLMLFQKEKGYEKIVRILEEARRKSVPLYINAISLGEIIYITQRHFGEHRKIEALAHIERLGFITLPATNDVIFDAAEHKARYSISYADCFVLVSAVRHNGIVVTGDPEFKKVEHLAEVLWV